MRIIIQDDKGNTWDTVDTFGDNSITDLGEARSLLARMVNESISDWAIQSRARRSVIMAREAAANEVLEATSVQSREEDDDDVPF